MRNNRAFLLSFMRAPKLTAHTYTHLHKIPPDTHHTPLHTHTIIHTKILPHTHTHKIFSPAHHISLHPHTIIHSMIFMRQPITHTRNSLNIISFIISTITPDTLHHSHKYQLKKLWYGTTWYVPRRPCTHRDVIELLCHEDLVYCHNMGVNIRDVKLKTGRYLDYY